MTNEEAIKMFSVALTTAELCDRKRDLYRIAINALEKQMPKKPKKHLYPNTMITWRNYCPICGEESYVTRSCKYCPECGQKIDWSDDNDRRDSL